MEIDSRFRVLKEELLERAHKAGACAKQYSRAYRSQSLKELMDVVKDNFSWVVENRVLDGKFIDKWSVEFSVNEIWHNQSVSRGYLIASGNTRVIAYDNTRVIAYDNTTVIAYDNTTVIAYDNTTVIAYDNTRVIAYDNTMVEAYDNTRVEACGNTTVEAYNNTYVSSWNIIECNLSGAAIWRIWGINTVRYADDNMKFKKIPQ